MTRNRKALLGVSAVAMALCGAASTRAADQASLTGFSLSPVYAADTQPAQTPLMSALDQVGVGAPLESARIDVTGWIEGSYNYNFMNPAKEFNVGHDFDDKADRAEINQLVLNFERDVDPSNGQFDIGGRLELLYGTDANWTTSNSLYRRFVHPYSFTNYEFDTPDMYIDIAVPVGSGLLVRLGRFEFWKPLDPNQSVFFSHTFAYNTALPFTNTGITAAYNLNSQVNLEAGFSRGDDQSTSDDNGAIDFIYKVGWHPSDKLAVNLYGSIGPELPGDNGDYLFRFNPTVSYGVSDNLTILGDAVFAHQNGSATLGTKDNFYGTSGNAVFKIDDRFSVAGRLEWYRDETGMGTGVGGSLYEVTGGLTITPLPDDAVAGGFKIRPEIRYDYATRDYFNGRTRHDEVIAAVDAIFNF